MAGQRCARQELENPDLDLSRAEGTVAYKSGGVTYRREYFASYPDQVIVVRLSADKPGSLSGSIQLTDRHFASR